MYPADSAAVQWLAPQYADYLYGGALHIQSTQVILS
jgi:hypothetical protein